MNFFIKYLVVLLSLSFNAQSLAMQKEGLAEREIIEGDLFIVPNNLMYAKSRWDMKYLEHQLNTKFQADDVLVQVWATSAECEDWENGHPAIQGNFPTHLLYRMLKEKMEGDTLNLQMLNKTFVLHLCQSKYRYRGLFHAGLERLKNSFLAKPNFDLSALPRLLNEGILVANPAMQNAEIEHHRYTHGPNGFKG